MFSYNQCSLNIVIFKWFCSRWWTQQLCLEVKRRWGVRRTAVTWPSVTTAPLSAWQSESWCMTRCVKFATTRNVPSGWVHCLTSIAGIVDVKNFTSFCLKLLGYDVSKVNLIKHQMNAVSILILKASLMTGVPFFRYNITEHTESWR